MILSLIVFFGVLLLPTTAFAWGPITHLSYGVEVLNNLPMLIAPLQELLNTFPRDYLYGCLAADITLKKDLVSYTHHCHNWDVGLHILEKSKNDSQKAFAYGYLSHLAADTISHNYYVPYHLVATFPTKTLRHIYWELRFDATQDQKLWKMVKEITKEHHGSSHDQLLESLLKKTLFSFRTNKLIFNSLMSMEHSERWYKLVHNVARKSSWPLPDQDIKEFQSLAMDAVFDFLNNGKKSKFYLIDPSGKLALEKAKKLRKQFKRNFKNESSQKIKHQILEVRQDLKKALFEKAYHQQWIEVQ